MSNTMPTTGRYGWYRDHEGVEKRRVSTLVRKVETDTHALDVWKQRQVAEGLAIRNDLVLSIKAMGRPDPVKGWSQQDKKKIDSLVKEAVAAAKQADGARSGTAMHDLTERIDRGEPLDDVTRGLPALAAETLRAYAALRRLNGWVSVEIERTVECDELEARGSFDRIDIVPGLAALLGPGTCQHDDPDHVHDRSDGYGELPVIVDVKTEGEPWRNGLHIGPQLAIYSRARRMWNRLPGEHPAGNWPSGDVRMDPNGEYVPTPCVRQDVAIVVHLRDGHAVPYFVNLTEGWDAAKAAHAQAARESRAKRALGAGGAWFAPVPNVAHPPVTQTLVETAVAAGYADPHRIEWPAIAGQFATDATPVGPLAVGVDGSTVATAQLMSDGATHYTVGDTVNVGGVNFVKHSEIIGVQASATPAGPVTTHYAVTPSGAEIVGGHGPMPAPDARNALGRTEAEEARMAALEQEGVRTYLIKAIWQARTLDALAILWNMARDRGVRWSGPVEMAADARRRQIECPQRALHTGGGKCACGWMPPVPA